MAKRHVWCHEMTIKNVNEKEKKLYMEKKKGRKPRRAQGIQRSRRRMA